MTVDRAAAVGGRGTLCVPSLDNALIAMTLGDAGHVNMIACGEQVSLDLSTDFEVSSIVELKFLEMLLGRNACLLEMTEFRLGQLFLSDIAVSQLHGNIAIVFDCLLLSDDTGTRFNNGNGDHAAGLIEDLGHAHFLADDCFLHFSYSLF